MKMKSNLKMKINKEIGQKSPQRFEKFGKWWIIQLKNGDKSPFKNGKESS